MILQAFREAGKALDAGDIVCIFPEGQLTRTGLMAPFQRGPAADRQGPHHADHPGAPRPPEQQHLQPGQPQAAARAAPLPGDDLVRRSRCRPTPRSSRCGRRSASSTRKPGPTARTIAGRCIMGSSARRDGTRSGWPLPTSRRPRSRTSRPSPGSIAIARALRPRWDGQANVGILLPASVGGALVNLAASLAGKTVVNLNFTTGRAGMESAAAQAGLKTVVTSRAFLEKGKLEPPTARRARSSSKT